METAEPARPAHPPKSGPPALAMCAMNFAGVAFYEPIEDVLNVLLLPSLNPLAQGLVVIEAVFGGWLLYWLNTKPVAALFKRRPSV